MNSAWFEAALIALTSVGATVIALLIVWLMIGRKRAQGLEPASSDGLEETVFLFDNEELVDATPSARRLLEATPIGISDWARLSAFIAPRFSDFHTRIAGLAEHGQVEMTERSETPGSERMRLIAEDVGGLARITLIDPGAEGRGIRVDSLSQRALEDELEMMRSTLDRSPVMIWRSDATGAVTWANRAYLLRADAFEEDGEGFTWPLPVLFDLPAQGHEEAGHVRVKLMEKEEGTRWYDCQSFTLTGGAIHFALPADATVRAEAQLREFVQTLTKIFADLTTGLAIFDRNRQLQLFNPALIDLLQLGPDFLTGRPTLYAFLDRLRETRMMPEPKDYRSWRIQMTELEQAAASGFHSETWNLPNGQTYRVTGRPHADGAVAFLFEDISAEVSLTRRFRGEIEMGQDVLDALPDAVVVFHPSGELALSNTAYAHLWGLEPETTLGRITLSDAIAQWEALAEPTALWSRLRAVAREFGRPEAFSEMIALTNGLRVSCALQSLPSGAVMVRFSEPVPRETAMAEHKAMAVLGQG
ncbi:hypothetical protein TP2_05100 [Thioclava pacifica DSM 10166]|uniref:PAS domain-containing protein n=2 Tax=Thioclava pacifica TaxID=285109 RepID=A0A074JEL3_9RHOB|nr:hypothetical protein TP2_05100 [Thioclava pacifica DSM 10166]